VIDVGFIASDDYGIAKADIFYRKNGTDSYRRRSIRLGSETGKREIARSFTWDLSDVPLFPGNYVEYFLQVADNNVVTGPGITKSRIFHIAVPTLAELYEKIQEEDAKRADLFAETMTESKDLKDRLEKLSREFKKNEKMDWAQKKEVDKAISSQENIEEKLDEIQQSLEETLESLSDNQMTSQEIGEKLEEIKRLVDEINDEALTEYVNELREAMEKLNPEQIQKALENLNLTAEDLLKSLERTESLLREIQQEQQMEELVRESKDLMDEQERVGEETADTDESDRGKMGELSEEQQALSEKAKQVAEKMKQMAESSDSEEFSQEMKAAAQKSEGQTAESMQQASRNLREGEKQPALEKTGHSADATAQWGAASHRGESAKAGQQHTRRVVQAGEPVESAAGTGSHRPNI
jgi:chromosome segregation ATPase